MRTLLSMMCGLLVIGPACAQAGPDNEDVGSVYLNDLPALLGKSKGALLLDVRSVAEFNDRASDGALNMGHLHGAMNVPIDSVEVWFDELMPYKKKAIYIYCSHSQRSRRVRDQLADSGFTDVHNVNEGLSGYWQDRAGHADLGPLIEQDLSYDLVDARGACDLLGMGNVTVLDVRPDPLLAPGTITERTRAMGRFVGTLHIPLTELRGRLDEIPVGNAILVVDDHGSVAPKAAQLLVDAGRGAVHVLFDGMSALLNTSSEKLPCAGASWTYDRPYRNLTLADLDTARFRNGMLIVDVRPEDEFAGTADPAWQNVGKVPFALHVPIEDIKRTIPALELFPHDPILVIGRSNDDMVYRAAKTLCEMGFTQVSVLAEGIAGMRWAVHNRAGMGKWAECLEDPAK
ncbi:MAG: rhodanese-like domain-containing protein [Flavobacteriales bacterium]|nr:rhodanese-like domain-containing protein [Flavobacteriales bacterium]MCB9193567.1 rhodanese-like domain-containing protein [Flavobacteriales bacterium]